MCSLGLWIVSRSNTINAGPGCLADSLKRRMAAGHHLIEDVILKEGPQEGGELWTRS